MSKRQVSAEIAGRNLTLAMVDADDCWRDTCGLRSYMTTGPVALCEVAFARAALTRYIIVEIVEHRNADLVKRLVAAAEAAIIEAFDAEGTNQQFLDFYGESLVKAGPKRIATYLEFAWYPAQMAALLGDKLGVPGMPSVEAAFIFENTEKRVRNLLEGIEIV